MLRRYETMVIAMVIAVACAVAPAQDDVQVRAQILPQTAYLGSQLEYTVSVLATGRHDVETPVLDLPAGVRLFGSPSTSTETRQGTVRQPDGTFQLQMVVRRSFIYSLSADRIGDITIPPATVRVDGKDRTTEAVSVTVRQPQAIDGFSLEARLSSERVYANEPFTLYLTWYVGQNVQEFGLIGTDLPSFVRVEPISPPSADRDRSGRYPGTTVYGERIYGTRGEATIDGRRVLTVSFEIRYRCSEPGSLDLGPMSMIFDAVDGRTVQRGVAKTGPLTVTVLPLPSAGKPAGFTGLIGAYSVASEATPVAVNVGDPITLTVRVSGPDAKGVQDGPNLSAQPAFADHFKLDPSGWEALPGSFTDAVFKTTVRALDTDITEVPPVELPYFDSDAGSYQIAASKPIPIEVRPSRIVTLDDAVVSSGLVPPLAREALGTPKAGLWAIAPEQVLAAPAGEARRDWWLVAMVIPPLLWVVIAGRDAWRSRAARPARAHHRAYRRAIGLARQGKAESAVRTYMGDALGQLPETVTAADCRWVIGDADAADKACAWLAADEATRFGKAAVTRPDANAVASLIRDLHASRSKGARA